MNNPQQDLSEALNDIFQFLVDSKSCFAKHTQNVNNIALKRLFAQLTQSRGKMIAEIKSMLASHGEFPSERGTITGKTHMVFENIKSLLTGGDALAITKEVRRGEGVLIEYYKNALALKPPVEVRNLLLSHLEQIQEDIKEADLLSVTTSAG